MKHRANGFTLIELLIVIGIIGFLAAAILVAVDPVKRVQDSRDARRYAEVNAILNAFLNKQVDDRVLYNGESGAPIDTNTSNVQVIVRSAAGVTCSTPSLAPTCPGKPSGTFVAATGLDCVVLLDNGTNDNIGLVDKYISELPIDPFGSGKDPTPTVTDLLLGDNNTGYYLNRTGENRIEIGACHPEQITPVAGAIRVKR